VRTALDDCSASAGRVVADARQREIAPGQVACAIRVTAGMATVSSSACAHDAHAAWGDPDAIQQSSRRTA